MSVRAWRRDLTTGGKKIAITTADDALDDVIAMAMLGAQQDSRQSTDRSRFDMSEETAQRASCPVGAIKNCSPRFRIDQLLRA